jgi:RNase P subunit RPR2
MYAYHIKILLSTGVKQKRCRLTDHKIGQLGQLTLTRLVLIRHLDVKSAIVNYYKKYNHKEIPVSLVGKHIDAHCTKCKRLLTHIVMYEVDGKVKKVKCKTCGSEHMYRTATQQKKTNDLMARSRQEKRGKTVPKSRMPVNDAPIQWELKYSEMNQESLVKDYRIQDIYKSGEVIRHNLFGLGFVGRVSFTSMEVLFKDVMRRMVMNIKK